MKNEDRQIFQTPTISQEQREFEEFMHQLREKIINAYCLPPSLFVVDEAHMYRNTTTQDPED